MALPLIPRGLRLNNPGNIRHVAGVIWKGQSPIQTDPDFVQFIDALYGLRAIARILMSYAREDIDTVQGVINRWAPPNENNSAAYVNAVCDQCAVGATTVIDIHSMMPQLIEAIIQHENGEQPFTEQQIDQGIYMAQT